MAQETGNHSMTEDHRHSASPLVWGGRLVTIGAIGVVITSLLYALAPPLAALPIPHGSMTDALHASVSGQSWLAAAGSVGMLADIIFAAGALVLLTRHPFSGQSLEAVGWALVAIANLIFMMVDALAARVLGPIAALGGQEAAFAGFKALFDILFILGTIAASLGIMSVLGAMLRTTVPVAPRSVSIVGIGVGAVGMVSALAYFGGINLAPVIGIGIGAGGVIFAVVGIQLTRKARRATPHS